jgi:hypothetical protein
MKNISNIFQGKEAGNILIFKKEAETMYFKLMLKIFQNLR